MATLHVALGGNDTTGSGSWPAAPYRTIKKALTVAAAGDFVNVHDDPAGPIVRFSAETFDAACAGTLAQPKWVKPYPGDRPVIRGRIQFGTSSARANYIHFEGSDDARLSDTADTIICENDQNGQHVVEIYSQGVEFRGCIVDKLGSYLGSCVADGWNGDAGQWQGVNTKVRYCLIRGVGRDPSYGATSAGHDHGIYANYTSGAEYDHNLIVNILGGWGVHLYTESTAARNVDGSSIHHNTLWNTRDGGFMLASDGTSTTQNATVDSNIVVNAGQVGQPGPAAYSFMVFWGGPTGTGNTGTGNHSHNPKSGHTQPGMTGWTLTGTTTGDPLFLNTGIGDFRLHPDSPALGKGAFGAGAIDSTPPTGGELTSGRLGAAGLGGMRLAASEGTLPTPSPPAVHEPPPTPAPQEQVSITGTVPGRPARVVHFALPFRYANGVPVVNEQDSADDVAACVEAVLRYPKGQRPESPEFGVTDPTFEMGPVDTDLLRSEVEEWEDRMDVLITERPDALDELLRRVSVTVGAERG